jgi:uncharacterized protein YodC (DUF2158 family)
VAQSKVGAVAHFGVGSNSGTAYGGGHMWLEGGEVRIEWFDDTECKQSEFNETQLKRA